MISREGTGPAGGIGQGAGESREIVVTSLSRARAWHVLQLGMESTQRV